MQGCSRLGRVDGSTLRPSYDPGGQNIWRDPCRPHAPVDTVEQTSRLWPLLADSFGLVGNHNSMGETPDQRSAAGCPAILAEPLGHEQREFLDFSSHPQAWVWLPVAQGAGDMSWSAAREQDG